MLIEEETLRALLCEPCDVPPQVFPKEVGQNDDLLARLGLGGTFGPLPGVQLRSSRPDAAAITLETIRIQMGDAAFGPFLCCVVEAENAHAERSTQRSQVGV